MKEIFSFGASVSFYMFHGGTNFGFLNGANVVNEFPNYLPDITSYGSLLDNLKRTVQGNTFESLFFRL